MSKLKFLALLAVLTLTLSLSSVAVAEDTPPHVFVGTVTVDGSPAPQGTGIIALVGGEEKGSVWVYESGEYGPLYVGEPTNGSLMITFLVDGHPADQTFTWDKGEATILHLTANDDGLIRPSQR